MAAYWLKAGGQIVKLPVRMSTARRSRSGTSIQPIRHPFDIAAASFEPRRVRAEPLDAARVRVAEGLADGERVVTEGASLLGQFR